LQLLFAGLAAWFTQSSFGFPFFLEGFVILFLANAYNFADGLDGLSGSLLLLIAVGLAGVAYFFGLHGLTWPICAASVGAVIPFLFINAPPARIFMGDVGALPIGAVLGWVVCRQLLESASRPIWLAWAAMIVVGTILIVELVMVPMQIAWVKLFKRRLFLCTPVHHAFEKIGWPETRIVASFGLSQLVLNCIAFALCLGFVPQGGQ
jgi:phospho-N-acetylmuramoyl-pentapeptide-transferase